MRARKWAFRELFDSEEEAARAYDKAVWRLRPEMALAYVNFPENAPNESLREAAYKRKNQATPSRWASWLQLVLCTEAAYRPSSSSVLQGCAAWGFCWLLAARRGSARLCAATIKAQAAAAA